MMFRGHKRKISLKSAQSLIILAAISAQAIEPCFARYAPQLKPVVVSEKPTLDLIDKLAHQPELLTPEYLQYILGRPVKRNVSDVNNIVYHWQTNKGGIGSQDCELFETRDANRKIVKAIFKVNLPRSTTTITDIEKKINGDADMLAANSQRPYLPQSNNGPVGSPFMPPRQAAASSSPSGLNNLTTNSLPAAASASAAAMSANSLSPSPTATLATTDSLDPFNLPDPNSTGNSSLSTPPQLSTPSASTAPLYSQPAQPRTQAFGPSTNPRTPVKRFFDQKCRPSLQYSFAPYTSVVYTQAPNTFHVHHAEIIYSGPPLPPPNQADIALVATDMRTRALGHHAQDNHNLAIPMLTDHLIDNPADAEAHYALGLSYQKNSNLNAAISEYQLAMRYSNGDQNVLTKATQSLQQLHVLPSPDDQFEYHTLRFKQNGQGLTEGDVISTQDRQSLMASRTPIYTSNAPVPMVTGNANGPSYANYQPRSLPGARGVAYTPGSGASRPDAPDPMPSFYNSMNYGSSLFPATAPNPLLEPGF